MAGRGAEAGEFGIFCKGPLDVHGEGQVQAGGQELFDAVGAHAVAVDLDGQSPGGQFVDEVQEVGVQGRLAAGDDDAVQPVASAVEVGADFGAKRVGQAGIVLGQAHVVAGGTGEVAAGEEEHAGGLSGPVAETEGLQAPHAGPWVIGHCSFLQIAVGVVTARPSSRTYLENLAAAGNDFSIGKRALNVQTFLKGRGNFSLFALN